jgi:DNA-binding CsgD family transcriptional regulator
MANLMAGVRRPNLTEGQINCLRLVSQNYTSKEIARQLGISPFTVDQRLDAARKKLSATSRTDAARRYSELSIGDIYEPLVYDPETLEKPADAGQLENALSEWGEQKDDDLGSKSDNDSIIKDAAVGSKSSRLSWIIPPPFGGKRHNLSNGDVLLKSISIAFISTIMVAAVIIILTGMMRLFP